MSASFLLPEASRSACFSEQLLAGALGDDDDQCSRSSFSIERGLDLRPGDDSLAN